MCLEVFHQQEAEDALQRFVKAENSYADSFIRHEPEGFRKGWGPGREKLKGLSPLGFSLPGEH